MHTLAWTSHCAVFEAGALAAILSEELPKPESRLCCSPYLETGQHLFWMFRCCLGNNTEDPEDRQ